MRQGEETQRGFEVFISPGPPQPDPGFLNLTGGWGPVLPKGPNSKTGEVLSDPASRKPGCVFPREMGLAGLPGLREEETEGLDSGHLWEDRGQGPELPVEDGRD